jgi:hypothetical protein
MAFDEIDAAAVAGGHIGDGDLPVDALPVEHALARVHLVAGELDPFAGRAHRPLSWAAQRAWLP